MTMFLRSEIDMIISDMIVVPRENRPLVQERVKRLQKLGFPAGINVGSGRRPNYSVTSLFQSVLAWKLFDLGQTPERVIEVLTPNWREIAAGIGQAVVDPNRGLLLAIRPFGLDNLRGLGTELRVLATIKEVLHTTRSAGAIMRVEDLAAFAGAGKWPFDQVTFISIDRMVERTLRSIAALRGADVEEDVRAELQTWNVTTWKRQAASAKGRVEESSSPARRLSI
jgi:hypothetical protein